MIEMCGLGRGGGNRWGCKVLLKLENSVGFLCSRFQDLVSLGFKSYFVPTCLRIFLQQLSSFVLLKKISFFFFIPDIYFLI